MRDRFAMYFTFGKWRSPNLKPKPVYQRRVWRDMAIGKHSTDNKIMLYLSPYMGYDINQVK